jgi:hypothetical protein
VTTVHVGQVVKLKPARADAYGWNRDEVFTVARTYQRAGYVQVWAELEGRAVAAPFNKVKVSELRAA